MKIKPHKGSDDLETRWKMTKEYSKPESRTAPQESAGAFRHLGIGTFVRRSDFVIRHSSSAFTMIEIALSLAIIGFALVAIIGILPAGMSVQKDNREETIVNLDSDLLLQAIRAGTAMDDLTNYVEDIQLISQEYDPPNIPHGAPTTITLTFANQTLARVLTNSHIIGLLSTPEYTPSPNNSPGSPYRFMSNYVIADFRAISGPAVDRGTNQAARDFAFAYRVIPQIVPFGASFDFNSTNYNQTGLALADQLARLNNYNFARDLQTNLYDVRLRFQWPLLPNGSVGVGRQTFRTLAGGAMTSYPLNLFGIQAYFIQPQLFSTNAAPARLP
jgi:type II secretory pathway pseudopilin PulG